jgi:ankyrin repeat protein
MMLCLVKELGANINQPTEDGSHCLHVAAQYARLDVMRCLVKELGVDVDQPNRNGHSSLFLAVRDGNLAMLKCLVEELSSDINRPGPGGMTPLMAASFMKHADTVRWLIKEGADTQATMDLEEGQ